VRARRGHGDQPPHRSLPALLVIAAVGVFGSIAIARFVAKGQHRPMNEILDVVALVLVLIGALLCLTAAIGLLRFHDVPTVCTRRRSRRCSASSSSASRGAALRAGRWSRSSSPW
jgi:uncharacterized membrane protein YidH (DUF202 family)